jgi:hypothetical protein
MLKHLSGCNDPGNLAPAEDEGFNINCHDPPHFKVTSGQTDH